MVRGHRNRPTSENAWHAGPIALPSACAPRWRAVRNAAPEDTTPKNSRACSGAAIVARTTLRQEAMFVANDMIREYGQEKRDPGSDLARRSHSLARRPPASSGQTDVFRPKVIASESVART